MRKETMAEERRVGTKAEVEVESKAIAEARAKLRVLKYPPRRERTASAMVGRRMMVIADGVVDVDVITSYL